MHLSGTLYACTTRDDIDLFNNKKATGEQIISFFVSISFVFFQTANW